MTERRALFIQGDGSGPEHTAEETRLLMAAAFGGQSYDAVAPAVGAIARGHGVIGAGSLAVAANGTPNDTVHVAAGIAAVRGTQENDQGIYVIGNDAQDTLTITASTTNPRNDLVVAQVRDDQYPAHTGDDWALAVVEGTPAGSPVDPAVPEDALVLARVRVPTGIAAVISDTEIDDLRPQVVACGGVTPVNALADLPDPTEGDVVWRRDVDRLAVHNGAAWRHLGTDYVASGSVSLPFAATADASAVIAWGVTFAAVPQVTVTVEGAVGEARSFATRTSSVTTTGCSVRADTSDGAALATARTLRWIAVGPLAS